MACQNDNPLLTKAMFELFKIDQYGANSQSSKPAELDNDQDEEEKYKDGGKDHEQDDLGEMEQNL